MQKDIKIGEPLEKAFDRTIEYCFQPFQFSKWLVMGFVTWIIAMGQGGGASSSYNFNPTKLGRVFSSTTTRSTSPNITSTTTTGGFNSVFSQIKDFIDQNLTQEIIIIAIIVAVVSLLVFLAIWLIMEWLRSRFQFIFLDNIVSNKYNIKAPWRDFKIQGNSLFKWSIFFTIISSIIILIMLGLTIGIPLKMCWTSIQAEQLLPEGKNGLIIGGIFLFFTIITAIALAVINFIVIELLIPIMYRKRVKIMEAWRIFNPVFKENRGKIILFIIVYAIVTIAVGSVALVALFVIMFITCFFLCLGFIPFVGGYITATIMLPVTIFYRMFSYEYIAQFKLGNSPAAFEEIETAEVHENIEDFDPKIL